VVVFWGCVFGYLLGSLAFGVWIPLMLGKGDPRSVGSGNIGATNVLRLAGKRIATLVFLADFLKGFIPTVVVLALWGEEAAMFVGISCVLGHVFPIWLRFSGGKGVATTFGVFAAMFPLVVCSGGIAWVVAWKFSRYPSIASLASIFFMTLCLFFVGNVGVKYFAIVILSLILYAHRNNLLRLVRAEEFKASAGGRDGSAQK